MEVARTAVVMVLSIVLPLCVQLWDRRRMDAAQRARVWNIASWGAALYAFGPLSLLGWSWVTRARWRRLWFGPLSMGAVLLVMALIDTALLMVFDRPVEDGPLDLIGGCALAAGAGALFLLLLELGASALAWRRARRVAMGASWSAEPPSPPRPASH